LFYNHRIGEPSGFWKEVKWKKIAGRSGALGEMVIDLCILLLSQDILVKCWYSHVTIRSKKYSSLGSKTMMKNMPTKLYKYQPYNTQTLDNLKKTRFGSPIL